MAFDVAAGAYDQFMGRYSRLLAPQMRDLAGVREGDRAIDVGCGPGALTSCLIDLLGVDNVAAADPSEPFVTAARARYPGLDVRIARAEELPFPDDDFDAALAQLVVHFMADPVGGVREMIRVTRPGGAIAACVWDHAGETGPLATFWRAVRSLDPDAEDEGQLAGTAPGQLVEILEAAGAHDVTESVLVADLVHPTFDAWWEPFTLGVGPAGSYVASLDAAAVERLRLRCLELTGAGPFRIEARAWAARGRA
jgi:SAM-dependent methyltransferase